MGCYAVDLSYVQVKKCGQIENADVSDIEDIADFSSPTFINPCFRYSWISKIRDFQTSVFSIFTDFFSNFNKSVFSIFTSDSENRKHGCLKISDFQTLSSEYRKLRFQKIRDFQTSLFSIFTIGEYRKHRIIKVGEKKSAISEKSTFSTSKIIFCW